MACMFGEEFLGFIWNEVVKAIENSVSGSEVLKRSEKENHIMLMGV